MVREFNTSKIVSLVIRPRRGMQRAQVEMLSKRVVGSKAGVADVVFEGI